MQLCEYWKDSCPSRLLAFLPSCLLAFSPSRLLAFSPSRLYGFITDIIVSLINHQESYFLSAWRFISFMDFFSPATSLQKWSKKRNGKYTAMWILKWFLPSRLLASSPSRLLEFLTFRILAFWSSFNPILLVFIKYYKGVLLICTYKLLCCYGHW